MVGWSHSHICLLIFFPVSMGEFNGSINIAGTGFFEHHELFFSFPDPKKIWLAASSSHQKVQKKTINWLYPSLPKSSKYLLRGCLEPLNAFSGGVWGSKHPSIWKTRAIGYSSNTKNAEETDGINGDRSWWFHIYHQIGFLKYYFRFISRL